MFFDNLFFVFEYDFACYFSFHAKLDHLLDYLIQSCAFLPGLTCIKTHKTYKTRRLSFREDQKPQGVKDANNTNEKLNSSNPDSKVHLHKRRSVLKETSTSRYRSFVEKNIRQIGLHGLSQRIKSALHRTLWKARQALEVS